LGADKPFKEIASDEHLSIAYLKVTKPSGAYVLLDFANSSSSTLSKLEVHYEIPRQYQVTLALLETKIIIK